jgi:prepilin-type N-terminal cleavage/methylation domain-containing protein
MLLKLYSRSKGFTLIELMIVVFIIAIISSAIVPSFSRTLQRNRQREAGLFIVQAVWTAMSRAARNNRCHMVRVFSDGEEAVNGGAVALYEATWVGNQQFNCSNAIRLGAWTQLSFKAISASKDLAGSDQAGLVGRDVIFSRVLAPPAGYPAVCNNVFGLPDPGILYFEPTGYIFQPYERYFEIVALDGSGNPRDSDNMYVRFGADGSCKYQVCE